MTMGAHHAYVRTLLSSLVSLAGLISSQVVKVYTTDGPVPSFSCATDALTSPITDIYLPPAHPSILVTSARDGHVRLYDMRTNGQVADIDCKHYRGVHVLALRAHRMITQGSDGCHAGAL